MNKKSFTVLTNSLKTFSVIITGFRNYFTLSDHDPLTLAVMDVQTLEALDYETIP